MKYLDTGSRSPDEALATWLHNTITTEVSELRIQTGFFAIQSVGILAAIFKRASLGEVKINMLVGSNDGETLASHIQHLFAMLAMPKPNVLLGIVSFSNGGYFHPKTYHVKRVDGTQGAYVGSANLTRQGLARHVEAAIALDTRDGDNKGTLNSIAAAVDAWFAEKRAGLSIITNAGDVHELLSQGILSLKPPPKPKPTQGTNTLSPQTKATLSQIVVLPDVDFKDSEAEPLDKDANTEGGQEHVQVSTTAPPTAAVVPVPPAPTPAPAPAQASGVTPQNTISIAGYPSHIQFIKSLTKIPPQGANALSKDNLPNSSVGVILRLNKDSARHFQGQKGQKGTANISLPIPYAKTFAFSLWAANMNNDAQKKPRVDFELAVRYLTDAGEIARLSTKTNVTLYGYGADPSGQPNLRMLIPAAVRDILPSLAKAKLLPPSDGDIIGLEWPIMDSPLFGLTLMPSNSGYASSLRTLFEAAQYNASIVGATCLLPLGILPEWKFNQA